MNSAVGTIAPTASRKAASAAIPWTAWACTVASVSIAVGLYWDISWHMSIGRDTFWTPAHLLIQFGGLMTAVVCGWTIFGATFRPESELRQNSVSVLGFRGPLGAFIAAWGGLAMVTSAPFDDWWHNAYGLDVKILSPPHVLLAIGIAGIVWGGLILTVAALNRAEGAQKVRLQRLVLLLGGFAVLHAMIPRLEYTSRTFLHGAAAYVAISVGVLLVLEAPARASGHRWARTIMTGIYSLFVLLMLWILPLFPATPKLGPVFQPITHMVPLPFPMLLVVPAFVLDLAWPRIKNTPRWQQALIGGLVFLAIFVAAEWPTAAFLNTPAARNWFFAPWNFPYFAQPDSPNVRYIFTATEAGPAQFWFRMGLASVCSVASLWVGIVFGEWLKRVRR
ncbi:MAG: hypothetical protein ACM3SW_01775 [Actinomycetota bacterium]